MLSRLKRPAVFMHGEGGIDGVHFNPFSLRLARFVVLNASLKEAVSSALLGRSGAGGYARVGPNVESLRELVVTT